MSQLDSMSEQDIYFNLTGLESLGFKPRIFPAEGNKIGFDEVLEYYKGTDFDEFLELYRKRKDSDLQSVKAYNDYVYEHPMHELLGKFIMAGFLDHQFNYKENYFVSLGDELLEDGELAGLGIREGIILRNGDFLPVKSKEAHRLGSLWLFLHGYRLERMVRYTSDYDGKPYFSSMRDYVYMPNNAIAVSYAQAVAMCNILKAKCNNINYQDKFCEFTDLCLMPGADSYTMMNNAQKLQEVLGSDRFNAHEVITNIRKEAVEMGIMPATRSTEFGDAD